MQTILGSGGIIGQELAKNLLEYTDKIRLVSRNPQKVNQSDELFSADLLNPEQVVKAAEGSDVVYLLAGLQYKTSVWQVQWPQIMENVIKACEENGSRLVFFDNVYMYGKVDGWMTEDTPYNPCSKKGELRAKLAERLMDETSKGKLQALIARSADFYGPGAMNTFITPMVFGKLKEGKAANWLVNDKVKHSFTYTPDAGKATALLGNTESAFNQVWHMPTYRDALTGEEFIQKIAELYNVKPKYSNLSKWMMSLVGLFNSIVRESVEMLYQYEFEYLFDSTKFEHEFFRPTSYDDGIKEIVSTF